MTARTRQTAKPLKSSRSKRDDILRVATKHFGRNGFADSMWAAVAAEVGIGSTALYHYFESKLHCLYVIMGDALEEDLRLFEEHQGLRRLSREPRRGPAIAVRPQ